MNCGRPFGSRHFHFLAGELCRRSLTAFVVVYTGGPRQLFVSRRATPATSISNFILKCNAAPIERQFIPYLRRPLCHLRRYLWKPAAFSSSTSRGVSSLLARLNSRELQLTRQLPRVLLRLVEISATGEKKIFFKRAIFSLRAVLSFICIIKI